MKKVIFYLGGFVIILFSFGACTSHPVISNEDVSVEDTTEIHQVLTIEQQQDSAWEALNAELYSFVLDNQNYINTTYVFTSKDPTDKKYPEIRLCPGERNVGDAIIIEKWNKNDGRAESTGLSIKKEEGKYYLKSSLFRGTEQIEEDRTPLYNLSDFEAAAQYFYTRLEQAKRLKESGLPTHIQNVVKTAG